MKVPYREGTATPPVPDVDALVQRLRAGVADKLDRGVYQPTDLEEVRRFERELGAGTENGTAAADDIARLHASWDPLGPHTFSSHRAGVGKLVVTAKRLLRWFARPVAAVSLARQAEFNGAVARLLAGASHGVRSLEAGAEVLQRRLDELERRTVELQARCEQLQDAVRSLRSRPETDDHEVKPG